VESSDGKRKETAARGQIQKVRYGEVLMGPLRELGDVIPVLNGEF